MKARSIAAALLVAGCRATVPDPGVPAVLDTDDPAAHREIGDVVTTALDGRSVTLAPDALTANSWLIVEQSVNRAVDRPPEPGRDLGRPERFRLVLDGNRCFLVHERTELRYLLRDARCRPE